MKISWAIKKEKNLCHYLNKKAKNNSFEKATESGIMGSKMFWSTVKPILSSKGFIHDDNLSIETENKITEDESELAKQFNNTHREKLYFTQFNTRIYCHTRLAPFDLFHMFTQSVKVGLSPSKNYFYLLIYYFYLKMMKNAFYFILKAFFVLKIFEFLS